MCRIAKIRKGQIEFKHYAMLSFVLCVWLGKILVDVTAQPLLFFIYYEVLGAPTVWHDSIFWTLFYVGITYGFLCTLILPLIFIGYLYTKLKPISPSLNGEKT